jgi:AcrR family transcriptional regulator
MARPRDPDVDRRILRAVRSLIAEGDIAEVTIDMVARRASVSRPTIYRRWSSRAELLFAAQTNASVGADFPETGSLRGDLIVACEYLAASMAEADRAVAAEQLGRMIADASFAARVWSERWIPDRTVAYEVWDRAVERGEVDAQVDGHEVLDDIVAICLFRTHLAHRELTSADIAAIVDRVLHGVMIERASDTQR